jgi:5-methyltetrahydrofolate--homocysteine methyltransferase
MNTEERRLALLDLLNERILVLDGAMGTMLQQRTLTAADFGGAAYEGCNEMLLRHRPDVVADIHRAYYQAGSDMVETNSFNGTPVSLGEYGLQDSAYELNLTAAKLARQVADEFSATGRPRFVAGSMGPTTKAISVVGGVTFQQLIDSYYI